MRRNYFRLLEGLLFSLPLLFASCGNGDNALEEIINGGGSGGGSSSANTYRVYTSGTAYTDEALPTSGVTTEANITNTWSGDIVIGADKTLTGDVTLAGDVNLIIKDGAELKVNGSILGGGASNDDYSLKIYGQSESTGKLTIDVTAQYNFCVKSLEVHGCVIKGTSADQAIENATTGTIKIYNGTVDITGEINGIMALGDMTIYGGTVDANSNNGAAISVYNCNLTISGGEVTATASTTSVGIDVYGTTGNILISGGVVEANGSPQNAGISGGNDFNITGGTLTANGGSQAEGILAYNGLTIDGETAVVYAYGGDGANGEDDSNPIGTNGGEGIQGDVHVISGKLTAVGGNGGDGFAVDTGNGGDGAYAISGDITNDSGTVTLTGGNGGDGGNNTACYGLGCIAVSGTTTGTVTATNGINGTIGNDPNP